MDQNVNHDEITTPMAVPMINQSYIPHNNFQSPFQLQHLSILKQINIPHML
jgi:hypothetical protein